MELNGYRRINSKGKGGISAVALIDADCIKSATYDPTTDAYVSVELEEGAAFVKYRFPEDEACYEESLSAGNGSVSVTHRLSIVLDNMDSYSRPAVEQLAAMSNGGIVALVVTQSGTVLLVGYSELFETERALRVTSVSGSTGKTFADGTAEILTLASEDTLKAKTFTGDWKALVSR